MNKVLVIDDDLDMCALLQRFLSRKGYAVLTANSGKAGLDTFVKEQPEVVLTDFRLGDVEGVEVLKQTLAHNPDTLVFIMTGYSDIRTAVDVIKLGAIDYITKPIIPDEIYLSIKQALATRHLRKSPAARLRETDATEPDEAAPEATPATKETPSKKRTPKRDSDAYVITQSEAAKVLYRQIDLVAPTDFSVIIYGESGAGKESVARMIHNRSQRAVQPFIAMDCGAISKDLANSELFGHEKGAFTGALAAKEGYFEMASGGTLFFDEIANLPHDLQVSLLRVVQEKKLKRLGGSREIPIDVRIIVASNERLSVACRHGKFREDLYHRFNEFSIDLPPLRARKEDIALFANRFLQETAQQLNKTVEGFTPEVLQLLQAYPWYGNVRELKNVVKRAALLTDTAWVQPQALPFEIVYHQKLDAAPEPSEPTLVGVSLPKEPLAEPTTYSAPTQTPAAPPPIPAHTDLKAASQHAEYTRILEALQSTHYNKSKAAELLGIDRKTLYNKLKQYNVKF